MSNLCCLIPDDYSGGVASVVRSVVQQAADVGYSVQLLLLLEPSGRIEEGKGWLLSSLGMKPPALNAPGVLLDWLESHPQDVLFLNGCGQANALIPYLPPSVKCIYVVHDTARPYWQTVVKEQANLEAVIAVSQTVAKKFRHLLADPGKLYTVHNGCIFPTAPAGCRSERPYDLLFLGGDNPTKGAYDLLRLWKRLLSQGFEGRLHWCGDIENSFRQRIDTLPELGRIVLHGRVSRNEIFELAARCRVFLMLSRVEPFGMTTIETMSMGCVPIAWSVDTGTREIIVPEESGLTAPLGNYAAFADQALFALERQPEMAGNVMKRARTRFSAEAMWQGYQSVLDRVLALPPIHRTKTGQVPRPLKVRRPRFQGLPNFIQNTIRNVVARSPRLGYLLRDFRGW